MAKEIWINARFLTQQKSGVQQFAIEISKELRLINPDIKFISPANILHHSDAKDFNTVITGKRVGQNWEQIDLPKFLKEKNHPLLLNLCNSAPLLYSNNIVTIHDLAFLENPKWFSYAFRTWYKYLIPRIIRKSKHVFTVSNFSKNELEIKLKVAEKKITVIYNGISSDLIKYKTNNQRDISRDKIILTVGSINPRKNIKPLIEAFNLLNPEGYKLLIAGAENSNFAKEKFSLKNENIKFLGFVSDEELWNLYQKSELFVYPSLYEGFGIPVLEALYFECPVLANDLSVYKEFYGSLLLNYTQGSDCKDYFEAIKKILNGNLKRQILPEEILNKYSYKESAKKMNDLIVDVCLS